jgi:hypothetical protein
VGRVPYGPKAGSGKTTINGFRPERTTVRLGKVECLEASIKDELSLRQNAATTTQRSTTTTSQQHATAQQNAIATQPRRRLLQESRARIWFQPASLKTLQIGNWQLWHRTTI